MYTFANLEAAYFLHSLHALTTLLCFRETHNKILPVCISKDIIEQLVERDGMTIAKEKPLPLRAFMKLFVEFVVSLKHSSELSEVGRLYSFNRNFFFLHR